MQSPVPIFDGHNDVLLRLFNKQVPDVEQLFLDGGDDGQLDFPRAVRGGFAGGMFAIFVPSRGEPDVNELMRGECYDIPLPDIISAGEALPSALAIAAILLRIEKRSGGRFKVCRSAKEIRSCMASNVIAAVMHLEGAEAIDADFNSLDVLHAAGLRSIGPVWSRPNIFGHGVPFRFPSTPDTGPGLTERGKDLVRACNERRIVLDLSHMNHQGFWDVARLSNAPLIATHSNSHSVCPHARNLTDSQLAAIRDSGGLVGINFATCFLRPDGQLDTKTGLDVLLRHLDHMIQHMGLECIGFGSDFDGAKVPEVIGDVSGLGNLRDALTSRGLSDDSLRKLCHENWINVLDRTWGQ
ncbi:MAG TPA: dipeptidase [Aestuariivirgaceae bacterium]|jgi:membrane dipeptidase